MVSLKPGSRLRLLAAAASAPALGCLTGYELLALANRHAALPDLVEDVLGAQTIILVIAYLVMLLFGLALMWRRRGQRWLIYAGVGAALGAAASWGIVSFVPLAATKILIEPVGAWYGFWTGLWARVIYFGFRRQPETGAATATA